MRRLVPFVCLSGLLGLLLLAAPQNSVDQACAAASEVALAQATPSQPAPTASTSRDPHHPRHQVKVWLTTYRGRTFRVIQLPRCEHMEAVIAYHKRGETKEDAKERLGGVAVCTGAFHNSRSMALADFYQHDGSILSGARTGRWFLAVMNDGHMDLSGDYGLYKGTPGVSAMALGQRLAPVLHKDGFSTRFMNRVTDRMALGMSHDYIFIVQGKSDIWRLADFMQKELPCHVAVNCDGGHVVRGRAPMHIVFRWRESPPPGAKPPDIESLRQAPPDIETKG